MGSFNGHLLPGVFFFLFGLRWTYAIFSKYYLLMVRRERQMMAATGHGSGGGGAAGSGGSGGSDHHHHRHHRTPSLGFRSTAFYPTHSVCRIVPLEPWIVMISTAIGVLAEFITGFSNGRFVNFGNIQHILMYTAFGLFGAVGVGTTSKMPFIPPGTEYAMLSLSLFVEMILFVYHLHGRTPLDIHVHQLLIVAIGTSLVMVVFEYFNRDNVLASLCRAFSSLLQGSWFIQVGFILYNPFSWATPWAEHDHSQMMTVTSVFAFHILANVILMAAIGCFVYRTTFYRLINEYEHLPSKETSNSSSNTADGEESFSLDLP